MNRQMSHCGKERDIGYFQIPESCPVAIQFPVFEGQSSLLVSITMLPIEKDQRKTRFVPVSDYRSAQKIALRHLKEQQERAKYEQQRQLGVVGDRLDNDILFSVFFGGLLSPRIHNLSDGDFSNSRSSSIPTSDTRSILTSKDLKPEYHSPDMMDDSITRLGVDNAGSVVDCSNMFSHLDGSISPGPNDSSRHLCKSSSHSSVSTSGSSQTLPIRNLKSKSSTNLKTSVHFSADKNAGSILKQSCANNCLRERFEEGRASRMQYIYELKRRGVIHCSEYGKHGGMARIPP